MLNRLYIVVGSLAIAAILAAFLVPQFIQWSDYRQRMEEITGQVFGAPVEIKGDIEFSLLPQPELRFADVVVGSANQPAITVDHVEAQFSLIDFIRDRYHITRLVLQKPRFHADIDADGNFAAGLLLADQVTAGDVTVANAQVVDGSAVIADARTNEEVVLGNIDGDVTMAALRGPFSFQGSAEFDGQNYALRMATTAVDADGATQLSTFVRPSSGAFSISAEGLLTTAAAPAFAGTLTYRQAPSGGETELEIAARGDLVLTGKVVASTARVLLSDFLLVPDENRAGTRLEGVAAVTLGADRAFEASITGGVLALPPRNAATDDALAPYEVIRLLAELPPPPIPPLPGTLKLEAAEVDLRALSFREVRLEATADSTGWNIGEFSALLPGGTAIEMDGMLSEAAGRPNFSGRVLLASERLDGLALVWRKAAEGNPLFNVPGALQAEISLVGETLSLSKAVFTLDGVEHHFSSEVGFAETTRHLNVSASFGVLDAQGSAMLAALLPDVAQDASFGVTFPKGRFALAAEAATVMGLEGKKLAARGGWEGGVLAMDELTAEDLGGASFDARLTAFGSLQKPELSGTGSVQVASAEAPALASFYDAVEATASVRQFLSRSLPANIAMRLDAPSGDGGQTLAVSGRVGVSELTLDAQLGHGFIRALGGPMSVRVDLRSADPAAMTAQLGLGDYGLTPEGGPMQLVALIEGSIANSLETTLRIEGEGDSIAFAGNVFVSGKDELSGNGTIRGRLSDTTALVALAGAGGVHLPPLSGMADIEFAGTQRLQVTEIDGASGDQPVSGQLAFTRAGDTRTVAGMLDIGEIEAGALFGAIAGPAARIAAAESPWPEGPLAVGEAPRNTTGRIGVSTPAIKIGGNAVVSDATFELGWDATATRLRRLAGSIGGGTVAMELGICCAGSLPEKQISGRMTLAGVDMAAIVPQTIESALSGVVDGAARFSGTGESLLAVVENLSGEGSYTIRNLRVEQFSPNTFEEVAALGTVLELEPPDLATLIVDKLKDAPFIAAEAAGSFNIAGGVLRAANLAVEGDGVRLFGGLTARLPDLSLDGSYTMSPMEPQTADSPIEAASAQVSADIGGTLAAPRREYDVAAMVDGIMVRAYELEVARLEKLRAEDEARRQAAAAERARRAEAAAKQAAAEAAARKAAEEAARREADEAAAEAIAEAAAEQRAQEEAARQAAQEEALRRALQQTQPQAPPLDLGIPN